MPVCTEQIKVVIGNVWYGSYDNIKTTEENIFQSEKQYLNILSLKF